MIELDEIKTLEQLKQLIASQNKEFLPADKQPTWDPATNKGIMETPEGIDFQAARPCDAKVPNLEPGEKPIFFFLITTIPTGLPDPPTEIALEICKLALDPATGNLRPVRSVVKPKEA